MYLTTLQVSAVRNLKDVRVALEPGVNLFLGANGSGKTSILEAVHLLGTGRSFRSARTGAVLHFDADRMVVFGELNSEEGQHRLGVERLRKGLFEARLDGESVHSASRLASILPLQVLVPEVGRLVMGAPNERRRFLDWGVFHVEHQYIVAWRTYRRAMGQRNAAIRGAGSVNALPFELQMADAARTITTARTRYLTALIPEVNRVLQALVPELDISLELAPGWNPAEGELLDQWKKNRMRDGEAGYTREGPHRADVVIRHQRRLVAERLSRGQSKCLSFALLLAQGQMLENRGRSCIYLIDDLPSELDAEHRDAVYTELQRASSQILTTAVDRQQSGSALKAPAMFHVEHGSVYRLEN